MTRDAVRAALRGITDPREAWEALAARGLIDASWVHDPRRWFACTADEWIAQGGHASPAQGPLATMHPPTLRACAAIVADPASIVTAEALARETTRDAPTATDAVYWRITDVVEVDALCALVASDDSAGRAARDLAAMRRPLDPTVETVLLLVTAAPPER